MTLWTRRQFLEASSLAALTVAAGRAARAQQAAPPEVRFIPVRGGVGIFTGRGGTIGWLVDPEALIVVDSQFPETAHLCLDGLKERSTRTIDFLVNTHHHGDHTAGNIVFEPAAEAIVAHRNVPELQKKSAASQNAADQQAYAGVTYDDQWQQTVGGETLRLRYYGRAHTSGDSVVTFERANVVHMGDLVFRERHPFIDRGAGASARNWITVLEKAAADHAADTIYICGHAREGLEVTGDRSVLMGLRDYLTAVIAHVEKGIAAGRSRDEITALAELPGFTQYQGGGRLTLGSVLGVTYDELTS